MWIKTYEKYHSMYSTLSIYVEDNKTLWIQTDAEWFSF